MRLGLFDDKAAQPYFALGIDDIDTQEHGSSRARPRCSRSCCSRTRAACPAAPGGKLAVVGPRAVRRTPAGGGERGGGAARIKSHDSIVASRAQNGTEVFLSNYHGSRCVDGDGPGPGDGADFSCVPTPLATLARANAGGETAGALGCEVDSDVDDVAAAVAVAAAADAVVLMVGLDGSQEAEGTDRYATTLPGLQPKLVDAVLALRKPTVLVLLNGGAMSLGAAKQAAPAIVEAFYGGEAGAQAIADVLFGEHNPSGKLAATMYPPEYVDEIALTEMSLTAGPGRTHMFYTGEPEFAFGSGLSYTRWELAWDDGAPRADRARRARRARARAPRARDERGRDGKQTVLLLWRPRAATRRSARSSSRSAARSARGRDGDRRSVQAEALGFASGEGGVVAVAPGNAISSRSTACADPRPLRVHAARDL